VAVVQYTYTQKEYREWHKTNNTYNTKIRKCASRAPSLRGLPWHLPYNRGKSTEKPQSETNKHFLYLAHFFSEWEMFLTKVIEEIKTHFLWSENQNTLSVIRKSKHTFCDQKIKTHFLWSENQNTPSVIRKSKHAFCDQKIKTRFLWSENQNTLSVIRKSKHAFCDQKIETRFLWSENQNTLSVIRKSKHTFCDQKIKTHFLWSENQNTLSMIRNFFFFRKLFYLWDNVEKYCRTGQTTNYNMTHAHCILGT